MQTSKWLLLTCALSLNVAFAQENKNGEAKTIATSYLELSRIRVIPIKDTQNERQYELLIKLPEGYSENNDIKYPVIYYTDAMWHVETLSGSADYILEDAILVGISWQKDIKEDLKKENGAHVSRYRDYSLQQSNNPEIQSKYQLGQAGNHLAFIRNTVIKYVENNYQTDPGRRTYFGYSMGGTFGAYILLTQPNTFKNYILGSPSLRRDDVPFLSQLISKIPIKHKYLNANVFISYGSLEIELSAQVDEFISLLKNRNDESLKLNHLVMEGSHQTAFPMTTVRSLHWLSEKNDFPIAGESYFGQIPPGNTAEIFAPGIVSVKGRSEYALSFSPDFDEMYFSGEKEDGVQYAYFSRLKDGKWTRPEKANFTNGRITNEFEAFVNPDGDRVYFAAYDTMFKDENIWYVDRTDESWSEAMLLDSPINDDIVFYPNTAENGDLFYTSISKGKVYYAPNKNGKYPEVHELEIDYGVHGYISPSQDFLLVDARKNNDKTKDKDIHVCFKLKDGSWTKPINLGSGVNSDFTETCPSITPDGKYLFFSRYNEEGGIPNIYWVSAEVVDDVRPIDKTNMN